MLLLDSEPLMYFTHTLATSDCDKPTTDYYYDCDKPSYSSMKTKMNIKSSVLC
jgi:hypothetical protein